MRLLIIFSRPENAPPLMNRMFVVSIWMKSPLGFLRPGSCARIKECAECEYIAPVNAKEAREGKESLHEKSRNEIVVPAPYLGNVDHVSLHDFEQRVLHPLARDVAADADVPPALANLVDLVDVYDAPLAAFYVLSALEVQLMLLFPYRKKRGGKHTTRDTARMSC